MSNPFVSVFSQTFDVIVFSAGYAGLAAAQALQRKGRSVLIVERGPAPLWESAWAFAEGVGESAAPEWRGLMDLFRAHQTTDGQHIDGGLAEVCAATLLGPEGIPVLFYATPVGVCRSGEVLTAVAVGLKEGLRVLKARTWVDATDTGELLGLLDSQWRQPTPVRQQLEICLQLTKPGSAQTLTCAALAEARLAWHGTVWPNQWALTVDLPGTYAQARRAWVPALQALHAAVPEQLVHAVVSHGSVIPLGQYAAGTAAPALPRNVVAAVPALSGTLVATLADRFGLGLAAAGRLAAPGAAMPEVPVSFGHEVLAARPLATKVAVAGAGTGGALAAVAAAQRGAEVLTFDHLPYAGGIASGGGIHWYYFGVKGGLQEAVDARVREIMPLFGAKPQVFGFHPEARKVVLEAMLAESGATFLPHATLFGVDKVGNRVTHAWLATPQGPVRLAAEAWIDATGDGDLAAQAGAKFVLGRPHDGQLHAYSQSSGAVAMPEGRPRVWGVNYDAGFVDPTNSEDLTRARLVGVRQLLQQTFTALARPTYIAPALGLRQARHIDTVYQLTLSDLISRRTFPDAIGYTGCHYDNHAIDYEFESDEAMFWVWVCRQWRDGRTACQMPYRLLVPRGLENVWLACRAIGVSLEAHHSLRMQRDMQRVGEAAGLAAAIAVEEHVAAAEVPYEPLRKALEASGALAIAEPGAEDTFGPAAGASVFGPATTEQLQVWHEAMLKGAGAEMYHLYRAGRAGEALVLPDLANPDAGVTFRAAGILAMAANPAAEPRLREAITTREYGFEMAPADARPEKNNRLAPHWLVAAALLRRCGTAACLPDLFTLAKDPTLVHNARTALALTVRHLAQRCKLSAADKALIANILQTLLATPAPNAVGNPQRTSAKPWDPQTPAPDQRPPVTEDFAWQLHLAVGQAEESVGLPVHGAAAAFLNDPRATVRKAFINLLQRY